MQRDFLAPQAHCLPVNTRDHLDGHQRVERKQPREITVRKRGPLAGKSRRQQRAVTVGLTDTDDNSLIGRIDFEVIIHVHGDKGRDVKPFGTILANDPIIANHIPVDRNQIAVALGNGPDVSVCAVVEIDAERVEDETQNP